MTLSAPLLVYLAVSGAQPPAPPKPRIVVLDLVTDPSTKDTARFVMEAVMTELQRPRKYDVMGSSDLQALLGMERQRQLLGCTDADASCLAELSGAAGADFLVTGSLGKVGASTRIDLKLLDTKSARVVARDGAEVTEETLARETRRVLATLLAGLPGGGSAGADLAASASGSRPLVPKLLLGVGAVGIAVGVGLVAFASTFDPRKWEFQQAVTEQQKARTLHTTGLIVLGAGAAVAAASVVWLLASSDAPAVALVPSDSGFMLALGGRF